MKRKYKFTGEMMEYNDCVLHRIKLLIDIPSKGLKKGHLGGWLEAECNLSHKGDCWVDNEAKVYNRGQVVDNADVRGEAEVCGIAKVCENGIVFGKARVAENADVSGYGCVSGNAVVDENASVQDFAVVSDYAKVGGDAVVQRFALVGGHSVVHEDATISCFSVIRGNAEVAGDAMVGNATITDNAKITGGEFGRGTMVINNGEITDTEDCIYLSPFSRSTDSITYNKKTDTICSGQFKGSLAAFEKFVEKRYENEEEYKVSIDYLKKMKEIFQKNLDNR